jgi:hypothetical protein
MKKTIAFYDTECYPNYWLLKIRPVGCPVITFRLREGERFTTQQVDKIISVFSVYTVVSFNGIKYDVPMISAALAKYTPEQLKYLNDEIIVHKVKAWELGLPDWKPADHIDIMEVLPGAGGQKQYAGRIHYKTMRDLPYDPDHTLVGGEFDEVDIYCENDLDVLQALYDAVRPQLRQRQMFTERYGIDLRSKSDAQMAETVLKYRCELATGRRIYKADIDYSLQFHCDVPDFIGYSLPQLNHALQMVRESVFKIDHHGRVAMPPQLENLKITIGNSVYEMGLGGLHSKEEKLVAVSDENNQVLMPDVAAYYPNLMINSGKFPPALGQHFVSEFKGITEERLKKYKPLVKKLKAAGLAEGDLEYDDAITGDGGIKIMINGTFGKTNSPYGVLYAPQMFVQTTIPGQLSLLMLIEWYEHYQIPVISANTDGLVVLCPRDKIDLHKQIVSEWERRTNLTMETVEYKSIYARDVNSYFAISDRGEIKRKGEYAKSGLIEKKNPDTEICSDAVAAFLACGTPLLETLLTCRDIRQFVTIVKVAGGGVKLWGVGASKHTLVRDMVDVLIRNGWVKSGRKWVRNGVECDPRSAYEQCFAPQRREYLGKVVRWYYSDQAPGTIVYESNGNTVGMSEGAKPAMVLPDEFPSDIDYLWYLNKAQNILKDIGYSC